MPEIYDINRIAHILLHEDNLLDQELQSRLIALMSHVIRQIITGVSEVPRQKSRKGWNFRSNFSVIISF